MKTIASIKNIDNCKNKNIIIRNLSRIMDIRILDIDLDNGIICLQYENPLTIEQVKKELSRIGHPIQNYTVKRPIKSYAVKHGDTTISPLSKTRSSERYLFLNQLEGK